MIILGIGDNHDAGVALIKDGQIVAAISEERLNRIKCYGGYPSSSIEKVLEIANISPHDIDLVVLASKMTPIALLRKFNSLHQRLRNNSSQFSYLLNLYILYQVFSHKLIFPKEIESLLSSRLIRRKLFKIGFRARITVVDHHLAHAYSVFTTSGFKKALIFTIDAMGDGVSVTVNIGQNNSTIKRVYEQTGFSAINTYYSRLTEFLGFRPLRDEGKVAGLAAYATPSRAMHYVKTLLNFNSRGFSWNNYFIPQGKDRGVYNRLKHFPKEEVAAALQRSLEEEVVKLVSYWIQKTCIHNVALAGGLFANVKLNQRIHELPEVDSIYIFPHMGDGGLGIGAALSQFSLSSFRLKNLYLGPKYTDGEIKETIGKLNLNYSYISDIEKEVAKVLARGKVVARFAGRLEYGPRALGNRSILYQATDPTVKDWLNKRLKRTGFMPFAPVTLAEYADQCYLNLQGATYTARFMNICFDCTEWMKENCPGAVHVDGTARPQLVYLEDNPRFYRILGEYRKITGLPSLINTSFNIHEEPIVCSPGDAVKAFKQGRLDYLAIGNYLMRNDSNR